MYRINITISAAVLKAIFGFNFYFVSFSAKRLLITNIPQIGILNEDSPPSYTSNRLRSLTAENFSQRLTLLSPLLN